MVKITCRHFKVKESLDRHNVAKKIEKIEKELSKLESKNIKIN